MYHLRHRRRCVRRQLVPCLRAGPKGATGKVATPVPGVAKASYHLRGGHVLMPRSECPRPCRARVMQQAAHKEGRQTLHPRAVWTQMQNPRGLSKVSWCDFVAGPVCCRSYDRYLVVAVQRSRLHVVRAPVPSRHPCCRGHALARERHRSGQRAPHLLWKQGGCQKRSCGAHADESLWVRVAAHAFRDPFTAQAPPRGTCVRGCPAGSPNACRWSRCARDATEGYRVPNGLDSPTDSALDAVASLWLVAACAPARPGRLNT
jgi:hypothetical protein